jgi:glucose/arabinose dehydrogenase
MRPTRARTGIIALATAALAGALLGGPALAAIPGAAVPAAAAAPASVATTPETSVTIGAKHVLSGFSQPVQVTSAHDGSGRLFVVQKTGRVMVVRNGAILARPYIDLSSVVSTTGEQGLLSIAFSPSWTSAPWVFVAYTAKNGTLVVLRYIASSPSADVITTPGVLILQVPHPTYTNHNGGQLFFGPDKLLYIGTGDGGGAGDPSNNAQNLHVLNGKILRIDPLRYCPGLRYCPAPGNQFATSLAYQRSIWLSGLRNPWRFSVDPVTGWVWIGDVGQSRYEEVDVVAPGYRWLNMGWSCREGLAVYIASRCIAGQPYRNPLVVIAHPTAEALIGGMVYRGSIYAPLLGGLYVFGDDVTGHLWVYRYTGSAVLQRATLPQVTSFGYSDGNEIYAVTLDGGLYRITAAAA